MKIKLPYSQKEVIETKSPFGYSEISDMSMFNNTYIRNIYVIRIDILKYLTDYFSEETINSNRDVLYYILSGHGYDTNPDGVCKILEDLYKTDELFRIKMGKLFHFRDKTKDNENSFYNIILSDVKDTIEKIKNDIYCSIRVVKFIAFTNMYLYVSIKKEDVILYMHGQIKHLEVISR